MMKSVDNVGVTFAALLIGRGVYDGVINVTLGAPLFTPETDGQTVVEDIAITSRLRMTPSCARQLYEGLGELLKSIETTPMPASAPETESKSVN